MKIITDYRVAKDNPFTIPETLGEDTEGVCTNPLTMETITRHEYFKLLSENPMIQRIPVDDPSKNPSIRLAKSGDPSPEALRHFAGWDIESEIHGHDLGTTRWQIFVWEIEAHGTDELKALGLK